MATHGVLILSALGFCLFLRVQGLQCPQSFLLHGKSCYMFSTTTGSYEAARSKCKLLGSDLAKITSKEEHDFIRNTAKAGFYFVGATDLRLGGKWAWEGEATEIAYSNWAPGQPNRASEHCMNLMKRFHYQMNDAPCGADINFICERTAKC
ncbi:perlucin-like [Haliotis cracherodii]|uniref:perlucin-like n=1 Tax=Haliotis cracherodii TaxID=6455 RepID=UPI0039E9279C